jgi:type I restriction enzyme R subunit
VAAPSSPNFAFLATYDARLLALATQAEQHFAADPTITLFKLRQFGEALAQRAAATVGLYLSYDESQRELIDRLFDRRVIGATQRSLFHDLRRSGNAAVHEGKGDHREALHQLRMARELAVWFARSFGKDRKLAPGPFVPPPDPKHATAALHVELERLREDALARKTELESAQRAAEQAKKAAEAESAQRLTAEERAAKAAEEASVWEALAGQEIEVHREAAKKHEDAAKLEAARSDALAKENARLLAELEAIQAAALAKPATELAAAVTQAGKAGEALDIDEAATRTLIDKQLRDAGWEVDSVALTFERGARPQKGKNLAIAEWPTKLDNKDGWADYVLFAGLKVVGVVEAKRKHKDVMSVLAQAKRYSQGYLVRGDEVLPEGSPWASDSKDPSARPHKVPFLFATNGRPFLRQLRTKSGIWFLDARRPQNHPVPLEGWYTPEGLNALLTQDIDAAHEKLEHEPMPYIDREYQRNAILAVESALKEGRRELLVAMATGTGKTRTCIGLCYRLLKTKRFRRVLFLVDRNALGRQTDDALKDLRLEHLQTFTDIFDVKGLADRDVEPGTRLHIATIQAMVRRILGEDEGEIPPVDQYDCLVVDECHRGYLLDRELSDREFLFRDEADYISTYRRVLDHFDAAKIGLTATPALHTKEIFGAPIFSYSYREAVIDGFLVDHEPPIRIVTQLARDGIHYAARQEVLLLERTTQTLKKEELADDLDFDVDSFNKRVITESYNRAVLGELVNHIDPEQEEKTLIFCATDEHAEMVVLLLKEALAKKYGAVDDDAVLKITGNVDRPLEAIRRFRNEHHPSIAVTVDLLTTGIDVPRIANLVFLRRVRSRILYEQMIGRATRLCPEIDKERFRIFDAVDLYSAIERVTDMKPVVVNPYVTFEQLVKEITAAADDDHRRASLDELLAKLQRKKRFLKGEAAERFETAAGMSPAELVHHLKHATLGGAAADLAQHPALAPYLDRASGGGAYKVVVSEHADRVMEVRSGYGASGDRAPGDYLESFRAFLAENANRLPALLVVTQRPRELTREELRKLELALDEAGYSETAVQSAWRDQKNEDIAATIVGYIRQLALGSALVPYVERVDRALARLKKQHKLTAPQSKWLDRIGAQVKLETVVDKASLERGEFKANGGFKRLNNVFDGKLDALLGELAEEVWRDAG